MATCLRHAVERTKEDAAWDVWVGMYPFMTEETFKTFEEFRDEACQATVQYSEKSDEEVMEEMTRIAESHEKQKRGEAV